MKTIIVATDFSYNANNALDYAAALAAYTKSSLILFHAFQLPLHASNALIPAAGVDQLFLNNEERLENLGKKVATKFSVPVRCVTKVAVVTEALEELVNEYRADVVVMGMHENNWSDKLLGNTTTAVIRVAKYPVLVVPHNAVFSVIKKVLYAFNTSHLYTENNLSVLKDFANSFKAEVQVYHVEAQSKQEWCNIDTLPKTNKKVELALNEVLHSYKAVEEEDVIDGIEKGVEEFGANLLVMVPHRLSFWEGLLNQSTTRSMALRTHIPLLVVPNPMQHNYN